ncbi:hypothetical protein TWF694_004644 [Orbilia ellipsospora]|uniref:Uncharacterized protein n=1 Tax=Orbilia ellipsospora TaxID=2528407 RepID=A0AAV9WW38_9PEZI
MAVVIPQSETVEEINDFMQVTRRTNELGQEFVELGLNKRLHPIMQEKSLERRQGVAIDDPNEYEVRRFKAEFDYNCATSQDILCDIDELFGAAEALVDRKRGYEVTGWSTPGVVSLGNKPEKPTEFADCTPIQCINSVGKGRLVFCAEAGAKFSYGFGMDRLLIARSLLALSKLCTGWRDSTSKVTPFSFKPKGDRYKDMKIVGENADCSDWTSAICKSVDDKSKSQCLALKGLWGVPWSVPEPSKTTPAPNPKS